VLDAHPEIAMPFFGAFERAKEMAFRYYEDPNWSHLAWTVHLLRDERQVMGLVAWANGVSHNRPNLKRFLQYALEPGLIDRQLEVEALFHEATQHT
jgi:4,5-dihydroxyphthalate decarboxylase